MEVTAQRRAAKMRTEPEVKELAERGSGEVMEVTRGSCGEQKSWWAVKKRGSCVAMKRQRR